MKKIIVYILLLGVLLIPGSVRAGGEDNSKVNVYLFWGNGCPHCHNFLNFINDISPEYAQYFNLVGFEVWENQGNGQVLEMVADFLGENVGGVPFIVIGDKTFGGYSSSYNNEIKELIVSLYNDSSRYDVFEEMDKNLIDYDSYLNLEETLKLDGIEPKITNGTLSNQNKGDNDNTVSWMIVLTVVSLGTMLIKTNYDKKHILAVLKTKK